MANRMSVPITLSVINALRPGDVVHDPKLSGFGARRQKSAISYFVKLRVNGRQRWITLGRHGAATSDGKTWSPDTARRQAIKVMGNPYIAEKKIARVPIPATNLFAAVADDFIVTHGSKLKPRTLSDYKWLIRDYLVPAFGTTEVGALTRGQISAAHATWKSSPRAANLALTVLSKFMTWCEDAGYRVEGSNPVRRVQRYKENRRETFLQTDELARLGTALAIAETKHLTSPHAIAAIRLLILTGARLGEILSLEWSHVDLGRRMIFLPDSKTGKKPVPLNDAALEVLGKIPRLANNPFVIVGHIQGAHLVNMQKPWAIIRTLAKLDHVRIHDLRHTFASMALAAGGSLPIIGRVLGHSNPQTTQRYAHLTDDPVRQLTQSTGKALTKALNRKPAQSHH